MRYVVTREVPQGKNVDPKSVTARIIVAFQVKIWEILQIYISSKQKDIV